MNFGELTDEQKVKARACKTPEDILALAREEGYELTDAKLEAVSGGLRTRRRSARRLPKALRPSNYIQGRVDRPHA